MKIIIWFGDMLSIDCYERDRFPILSIELTGHRAPWTVVAGWIGVFIVGY